MRNWLRQVGWLEPYALLAPVLGLLGVFTLWPLVNTLRLSFLSSGSDGVRYVGLDNFRAFVTDPSFGPLVVQSIQYMALGVIGNFLLPIGLALATVQVGGRAADLFQALLFTPTVVAVSTGTLIWMYFYQPAGGLFTAVLTSIGVNAPNWLTDPRTALPAVAVVANWKFLGFNYLVALSGLRAIPGDILEAARLDGAHGWVLLRAVLIPLLAPTLLFLLTSALIQALDYAFVPVEVLTLGGPGEATSNLYYAVYQEAFKFFRANQAAAAAVLLILVMSTLSVLQLQALERRVHYET